MLPPPTPPLELFTQASASLDDSFAIETEPEEADLHGHIVLFKAGRLHNRARKCMHGNH